MSLLSAIVCRDFLYTSMIWDSALVNISFGIGSLSSFISSDSVFLFIVVFISLAQSAYWVLSSLAWYRFSKYCAMCSSASVGSSMGWPLSLNVMYELLLCLGVISLFSFTKSCDFVPPSLLILLAKSLIFVFFFYFFLQSGLALYVGFHACFCLCWRHLFSLFSLFVRAFIVSLSFPRPAWSVGFDAYFAHCFCQCGFHWFFFWL